MITIQSLELAQKLAKIGHWELDIPSGKLYWSKEIYELFRLPSTDIAPTYEYFLSVVHPKDRDMVNDAYLNSLKTKKPYYIEHRLQFGDGELFFVAETCETTFDSEGKPLYSIGVVQDITQQYKYRLEIENKNKSLQIINKQNETLFSKLKKQYSELQFSNSQLTKSEEKYKSLIDNSLFGFVIYNYANKKIIHINHYAQKIFIGSDYDYNPIFFSIYDFFNVINESKITINKIIEKGKLQQQEVTIKNNEQQDIFLLMSFKHNKIDENIEITFIDISDQKRNELKLKNTIKENFEIKNALNKFSIVAITDLQGKITYVNEKFCEVSKYTENELIGKSHKIINSGYHPKSFFRDMWKTISNGGIWTGEIKNKAKDGTYYWVDTTITPTLDENDKPFQYISIRRDITNRKNMEELLEVQRNYIIYSKLEGIEQEKDRISKELHDGLGQILTAAKLSLSAIVNSEKDISKIKNLEFARKMIINAQDEVKRISNNLSPLMLTDFGLIEAIKKLIEDFNRISNTIIHFESHSIYEKLSNDENFFIYRIIQESLNNAYKYAEAKNIYISLSYQNSYKILKIEDDGRGFNSENIKKGSGINNMKYRVELLNGIFNIISNSSGTKILIKF